MKRVLVFGISGATWRVIDPMLDRGRLPVLQRLIAKGCRAKLASVRAAGDKHFRPQIAWPTIATGVAPDRHGVTRFFHTADDVTAPTIWDRFQQSGARVGTFCWPITWPVRPVNGFMIPAYDGRDLSTWPPEASFLRTLDRRQEAARRERDQLGKLPLVESMRILEKLWRGGVRSGTLARLIVAAADLLLLAPRELRPLLLARAKLQMSADIFLRLCRKHDPQFAAFVAFLTDYASHRYWLFHEPHRFADAPKEIAPRLHSAVEDSYAAADRALGKVLRHFDSQTIVAVLSEHGMAREEVSNEIGPWHYALRPVALKEFVGIDGSVSTVPIARWIAFRPPHDQMAAVADRLRQVYIEGMDLPLFQIDLHRDEVIVKLALRRALLPGIDNLESLQISFRGRVVPFTTVAQRFLRRRSAMHAEDGILILHGPGVRRGNLDRAQLIDIAPTLLKAAGIDASDGLPGRVLDVFELV